jgi:hypothetical protein
MCTLAQERSAANHFLCHDDLLKDEKNRSTSNFPGSVDDGKTRVMMEDSDLRPRSSAFAARL